MGCEQGRSIARVKAIEVVVNQEIEVGMIAKHVITVSVKPGKCIVDGGQFAFCEFIDVETLQHSVGISVGFTQVASVAKHQFHILLVRKFQLNVG